MDLVQKYTEQTYSSREEVLNEFDVGVGDVIWNEIWNYRKQFCYPITCFSTSYEVILCRNVLWKIMRVEQLLLDLSFMNKDQVPIPKGLQTGIWQAMVYETQHQMKLDDSWYLKACSRLSLQEQSLVMELLNMETFFTLRLFLCGFLRKQDRYSVAILLFLHEQRSSIVDIMDDNLLFDCMNCYEKDITYAFLEFLKQLELKISQRMVLLKGSKKSNEQTLGLVTLKECYPQFSEELLSFYVSHRSVQHYYTIQQYVNCCHVCYETARYSLDQLVEYGWYQKQKLGKKFVYYV